MKTGSAYAMEHGSRPATIRPSLDSSPLALLAWIGEKLLSSSDIDHPLETVLKSVSLYWSTESMGKGVFPCREVNYFLS
jgi:microsomal epoxide hydrolase